MSTLAKEIHLLVSRMKNERGSVQAMKGARQQETATALGFRARVHGEGTEACVIYFSSKVGLSTSPSGLMCTSLKSGLQQTLV